MSVNRENQRPDAPAPVSDVVPAAQDVAVAAAQADNVAEILDAALDHLKGFISFSRAAYLETRGHFLRLRHGYGAGIEVGTGGIALADFPDLPAVLKPNRTLVRGPDLEPLFAAVDQYLGFEAAVTRLLIPVIRIDGITSVLALATRGETLDQPSLHVTDLYGALIGVAITAAERAHNLEELRRALEERNEMLVEQVRSETSAGQALEAAPSRTMRRLVRMAQQVAVTDAPVLITGETGTGKEVLARAIHEWSARSDATFAQINCAALPEQLIESELFGHLKGAFSGAVKDRSGRFRIADGGTILLDEVGDLPLEAQAKLLRVLENGTLQPVGSDETIQVNVRVIAATNVELEEALERGAFREDLYFRLHVFPIHLPPLRERPEDIPALVELTLQRVEQRTGHGPWTVSRSVLKRLQKYDWPGNVRELVNAIERARVFAPLGGALDVEVGQSRAVSGSRLQAEEWPTLDDHQRDYIERVLEKTNGKIYGPGGAAQVLDMKPSTLQSRMRKLGIR